eukprot:TRINITY_DN3643_c0_g1_i3.p1 TRINITY_DN3643_c0_g1~~TRINITY_DN3643_c0_g1_i3.p1  ORF type:complete len:359 (-),score=39.49 TRINITY_DN3643_c0_g1_i3:149-1168(-)
MSAARCLAFVSVCVSLPQPSSSLVHTAIPSVITDGAIKYGGSERHFVVIPELKLALCRIPKIAYTQFNRLFEDVSGGDNYTWESARPFNGSIDELFDDNTWTKAVFLRDPLARLVSGYADKCEPPNTGRGAWSCMNFPDATPDSWPSFDQFVHEIHHCHNPHFDPQSSHCFLSSRRNNYDFVGHLTTDYPAVTRQVRNMLTIAAKRVGCDTREKLSVLNEKAATHFPREVPGSFTKGNLNHFHLNVDVQGMFHANATLKAALMHYAVDYMSLPLSPPQWVGQGAIRRAWQDALATANHADSKKGKECREQHSTLLAKTALHERVQIPAMLPFMTDVNRP